MGRVIGTCKRIVSPRAAGWGSSWNASADEILTMLGVKRLPVEGMPERVIDGVRVYVRPLVRPEGFKGRFFDGLRVMAICDCGRHVAVGRLGQHKCKGGAK